MSDELPPVSCVDESTWRHKDEKIDLPRLLQLIEENGTPTGLDLHGCDMDHIDASPEALRPYVDAYAREHPADPEPPWLAGAVEPRGISPIVQPRGIRGIRGINLYNAHLEHAILELTHLQHAVLSRAQLENASLAFAQLEHANLELAEVEQADLNSAQLENATLHRASLQNANIHFAHLQGANLRGAYLQNAALSSVYLENADLGAAHLRGVVWYAARLDRTLMRRDQLGHAIGDELRAHKEEDSDIYHEASEAYLLLKNNFSSIGRYEDASWAYVKEQQMEKMAYHWEWRIYGWRIYGAPGSLWRWLRNWAYELLTGYGEQPILPVLWALAVIFAFTVGYAVAGNVSPDFAGDPATAHGSHSFRDALTHSIGAFATIGFNTLEPLGWGARLLTAIESALGVSLFALFIFTLGNRMSRS